MADKRQSAVFAWNLKRLACSREICRAASHPTHEGSHFAVRETRGDGRVLIPDGLAKPEHDRILFGCKQDILFFLEPADYLDDVADEDRWGRLEFDDRLRIGESRKELLQRRDSYVMAAIGIACSSVASEPIARV